MIAIKIIFVVTVIFLALVVRGFFARNLRRKRLLGQAVTPRYKEIIEKNIPLYKCLPEPLKEQLGGLINVFLDEKTFEGCGSLEMTDEIRVTIAGQACMLLLNRKTGYFRKLQTICVYPATYIATEVSGGDLVGSQPRLGESWQNGPVVLAWNAVTGGAVNIHDGRNVVFHEFSHQLDQEDGVADGAPILENRSSYATWAKVLGLEYKNLRSKAKKHRKSSIRKYGATHPAEFFAVATEAFLEKPKQMNKRHPELYEELKNYYKIDPVSWS